MKNSPVPDRPELVTLASYARACHVSRQAIDERLRTGTLTAEQVGTDGNARRYINTTMHPATPSQGRWPNRPPGSVPLPRKAKKPLAP